jgi:hypothetical protein
MVSNKDFPNGFDAWQETHFEVVSFINDHEHALVIKKKVTEEGHGGLWNLAEDLTDEFELKYRGHRWGEKTNESWYDTLDKFLEDKLY